VYGAIQLTGHILESNKFQITATTTTTGMTKLSFFLNPSKTWVTIILGLPSSSLNPDFSCWLILVGRLARRRALLLDGFWDSEG
jgi:hypothetical protein